MSSARAQLFDMKCSFPRANSMLRLLEPSDSCRRSLWERLFAGTYDKPFILDSGQWRFLHFDLDAVQSAMSLQDPHKLSLAYTRKMMAFLLFNHAPARILLLGLGGGSLAKFCYRSLPGAAVTAVEMNPDVIRLREEFSIPRDDSRFRVICADGAHYLAHLRRSKDVILADACDRAGIAPELDAIEFYQQVRRVLSHGGVFVSNMCGDRKNCNAHLGKIQKVFEGNFVTLQVAPHGNVIVLAFKDAHSQYDWGKLAAIGLNLKQRFSLDFPRYVQRMALGRKLCRWQ